jgi:hypothetical protein
MKASQTITGAIFAKLVAVVSAKKKFELLPGGRFMWRN